jgi:hypothetical protein
LFIAATTNKLNNMNNEQQRDHELWQMAKARVAFRWTLVCYFFANAMLVAVWYFYSRGNHFWPIWPILGWGMALSFQYYHAYHGNEYISTRKEYEKLKGEQDR